MTCSRHIYRMTQALRAMGWCVMLQDPSLGEHVRGRTHYTTRTVSLNCASARTAMLTLAHEFGHVVDSRRPQSSCVRTRERRAYLCGWAVVRWFGLPVTRAEWRELHDHLEDFDAVKLEEFACPTLSK